MADVAENAPFTDPATAISQGRRHLLVRDYSMAVTALAQACELLAEKYGDTSDELGELYLLYGRALLGLAREESGVLGGDVLGSEEAEEDEDDDEDEVGEDKQNNTDDKEEDGESNDETDDVTAAPAGEKETKVESNSDDVKSKELESKGEGSAESEVEDKSKENGSKKTEKEESNKTDDSKIAEQKKEEADDKTSGNKESVVEADKEKTMTNGESSAASQNGVALKNGEEEGDDVNKEDDEDDVNNLQLAWEVLELAKLVLLKRGSPGWKLLAEAHMLLGEVAMEGGNHEGALMDLQSCLELLEKIEPCEPRAIAEVHYQLGLAHSLANDFDASIERFNEATTLLEARIKQLEETAEPPKSDDPFYTTEGEIKELKELLPEIQEKIADMRDFKQEACRIVIEGLKSKVASDCSNGAGTSSDGTCSSSINSSLSSTVKPASDISHLVRKKRKAGESESELSTPCKKPMV